jgi:hypothetical protein
MFTNYNLSLGCWKLDKPGNQHVYNYHNISHVLQRVRIVRIDIRVDKKYLTAISGSEQGSSVSAVSDHGLHDRAIGVRSPAGAKDFSSILCVQTGSGAHPVSCPMGTGGPFPGGKSAAEA